MRTGRAHSAQATHTAPYRGAQWRRIVAQHRPCRSPPRPYHHAPVCAVPHVPLRVVPCMALRCIVAHRGLIAAPGCPVLRHMVTPSQPRYSFVSRPSSQRPGPCSRAWLTLRASRLYRGPLMVVSWRRLDRVVAESWPCRGPLAAPRPAFPASVSQYKLLYRACLKWAVA